MLVWPLIGFANAPNVTPPESALASVVFSRIAQLAIDTTMSNATMCSVRFIKVLLTESRPLTLGRQTTVRLQLCVASYKQMKK